MCELAWSPLHSESHRQSDRRLHSGCRPDLGLSVWAGAGPQVDRVGVEDAGPPAEFTSEFKLLLRAAITFRPSFLIIIRSSAGAVPISQGRVWSY